VPANAVAQLQNAFDVIVEVLQTIPGHTLELAATNVNLWWQRREDAVGELERQLKRTK